MRYPKAVATFLAVLMAFSVIAMGAAIAVLFVLPPLLAVCGRRVFWPFIPRPGQEANQGRAWRAVATHVSERPVVSLLAGLALLTVMATGLFGTSESFAPRRRCGCGAISAPCTT